MAGKIWLLIFNPFKGCASWEQMYWAHVVEQGIQWQCAPAVTHFTPDGRKLDNSTFSNRHTIVQLVEALCYKLESHQFESWMK
jgi:hypothetical protein